MRFHVKRVKRISLLLLVSAGALSLVLAGSWLLTPKYQGKTASAWFKEMCNGGMVLPHVPNSMSALVTMGDDAAPFLAAEFARQEPSWKQNLTRWLREKKWMSIPSERQRSSLAYAVLLQIGPKGRRAMPALVKAASNKTHPRRAKAIQLIGTIHRQPKLAVPALIDCLNETNGYVRTFAATALGAYRAEGKPAMPALREALTSQDVYLAVAAASALLRIDDNADWGWPLLIETLQSPVATHRVEAARALGNLERRAEDAIPMLRKCVEDEDQRVRRAATLALQQISSQRVGNSFIR